MRSLVGILFAFAFLTSLQGLAQNGKEEFKEKPGTVALARGISQLVIARWAYQIEKEAAVKNAVLGDPLLPDIDDPAYLDDLEIPLNIDIVGYGNLLGEFALCRGVVTGLSQKLDDFTIVFYNPINGITNVTWTLEIPKVAIEGLYNLDASLNLGTNHTIVGVGLLTGSTESVFLNLKARATAPPVIGKIRLQDLDVDLGFKNLALDGGDNSAVDEDYPINWADLGNNIETYFGSVWNEETRPMITEMVRCSVDHVLNGCGTAALIGGDYSCLKLELNPACFPEQKELTARKSPGLTADYCASLSTEPTESTGETGETIDPTGPTSDTSTDPTSDTATDPTSDTSTDPTSDTSTDPTSDTSTDPTSDTSTDPTRPTSPTLPTSPTPTTPPTTVSTTPGNGVSPLMVAQSVVILLPVLHALF